MPRKRTKSQNSAIFAKSVREDNEKEKLLLETLRRKLEKQQRALADSSQKLKGQIKEVLNLGHGLRTAIIDMQRAMLYYRKETETFKNKQNEWIIDQQTTNNGKYVMKYVWADDILKVRLRRERKGGGMRIWFRDGDDSIFTDIDVWRDVFNDDNYNDPMHYDEFIQQIMQEMKQQIQQNDDVIKQEMKQAADDSVEEQDEDQSSDEDDLLEQLIETLLNEMSHRMSDIENISKIVFTEKDGDVGNRREEYVDHIEQRHNAAMKYNELEHNNHLWRELLSNELPMDIVSVLSNELDDRIEDLKVIKDVLLKVNDENSEDSKIKILTDFVDGIKMERHDLMFHEWDPERYKMIRSVMNENNSRWRNEIISLSALESAYEHIKRKHELTQDSITRQYEGEISELTQINESISARLEETEQALSSLQIEYENTKRHQTNISKLRKINDDIHNKSQQKLVKAQQQIVELKSEINAVEIAYELNTDSITKQYEKEISELTKMNDSISDQNAIHNESEQELVKTQQEMGELQQSLFALQIAYENMSKAHELKTDSIANQYETDISDLTKVNESISEQLKGSEHALSSLQIEYENAKQKHEYEICQLRKMNVSLSDEIIHLMKESAVEQTNETEVKVDDCWLFGDVSRNKYMDSIVLTSEQQQLVTHIGGYLNRIIPTSDDLQPISLQKLYVPMDEKDAKYVLHTCFDGVLFATLINLMQNDFLDLRALNIPNHSEEKMNVDVLNNEQIKENISIILSSVRALDICQFPSGTNPLNDYFDSTHTLDILLCLAMSLFNGYLNNRINIKSYPELIRFCQNENEKQDLQNFPGKEWLKRWLLFVKEPKLKHQRYRSKSIDLSHSEQEILNDPAAAVEFEDETAFLDYEDEENDTKTSFLDYNKYESVGDYHDDIVLVCSKLDTTFDINSVNEIIGNNEIENNFKGYQLIMKCIKNKIGIQNTLNITINDIRNHNYLLQQVLLSEIFMINNLIKKISLSEKKNINKLIKSKSKYDKSMIAWINSFGWKQKFYVNNLDRDFSDGIIILKLLAECKDDAVKWRNVRKRAKIRHKFDKLANCKMVMEVCQNEFDFSLVGMGGNDIVDENQMYIKTLLWQIKLCHSTKLINMRYNHQNKNKMITDKDMISWSNQRIMKYKESNLENELIKSEISSLKDSSLSDSIYFLNLIASINQKWVNYQLIHKIAAKNKRIDEYKKKRRANARYLITIIRRLGQNIFISVDDICRVEQRAVVSVIAAIMTINAKQQTN